MGSRRGNESPRGAESARLRAKDADQLRVEGVPAYTRDRPPRPRRGGAAHGETRAQLRRRLGRRRLDRLDLGTAHRWEQDAGLGLDADGEFPAFRCGPDDRALPPPRAHDHRDGAAVGQRRFPLQRRDRRDAHARGPTTTLPLLVERDVDDGMELGQHRLHAVCGAQRAARGEIV